MNQERTFQDITRVVSIYRGLSIKFEAYGKYKLLQYIVYSYEVLVIYCLVTFKENLKEFFKSLIIFLCLFNLFSISLEHFSVTTYFLNPKSKTTPNKIVV